MATMGYGLVEENLRGKRILVVDDEKELGDMVSSILAGAGFREIEVAQSAEEALEALAKKGAAGPQGGGDSGANLFILDVTMPGMDGFQLLGRLREMPEHRKTPAIFLTARDEPLDRVGGLSLGADDYIAKPFLPQELVLRIAAVLRRCYADDDAELTLSHATVDLANAEVTREDGTNAQLTAKEHEILSVLARNAGRIVTIDAICEECWGTSFAYENSLMAHVRRLREKIEADPSHPESLVTVRGLGYKLIVRK